MSTTQGIIVPPKDIREVADKTAKYVVENGENFESLVIETEKYNKQFCFLQKDDPYRAYYEHKKKEIAREQLDAAQQQQQQSQQQQAGEQIQNQVSTQNKLFSESLNKEQKTEQILEKKPLKQPDPDQYILTQPKGLSQMEIDIIKMTAQFVAKNGKNFVVSLSQREQQNQQFDFLKPTSDLFPYFSGLIDSYAKCQSIKKSLLETINTQSYDKNSILLKCGEKFEWEKYQKQEQKLKQEEEMEEKQKIEAIDWNDFVVVETIDFQDDDFDQYKENQKRKRDQAFQDENDTNGNPEKKIQIIQPTSLVR